MSQPLEALGASLDLENSLVVLAGSRFPACVAYDPADGGIWGGVIWTTDTFGEKGWSIFVPMENGALVCITLELIDEKTGDVARPVGSPCMTVYLHAPWWIPFMEREDDREVKHLSVIKGQIGDGSTMNKLKNGMWVDCEAEWLAEHISRLSTMPVVAVKPDDCIPLKLLMLSEAFPKEAS